MLQKKIIRFDVLFITTYRGTRMIHYTLDITHITVEQSKLSFVNENSTKDVEQQKIIEEKEEQRYSFELVQ